MPRSMPGLALALAASIPLLCAAVPVQFQPVGKAPTPAPLGFDYLHLVQEWPGSFCDSKRGCSWPSVEPIKGWLLHGLWPEFNNGSWPEYCDSSAPFNMTKIQDMLPELQEYWPSLVSPDEEAFWNHEWTRHGTCAEKMTPEEHDYFRLVLTLREKFDAYKILASKGIMANSTTTWRAVKDALESVVGGTVEVGCNIDAQGRKQLYEVRSCYEPAGARAGLAGTPVVQVDCIHDFYYKSCGTPNATIFYPPFGKSPTPGMPSAGL
mmetsp:Transcript_52047/g.127057  ORF Transcript_52047/g.127057 Transcript_52047/m.127057 type:complete len:265 (+) Transcript_52047:61-855(+)|eukprot:CAMPEP_0206245048 /NCGR_PEP_ID=MMETSP0047_2-20121206/18488_1 /ASSEMBLY_ACC=CAM_ASM_000192 /TAXON_ID=195065 /ORGANISM="Chroomonas mesostigmatica_cf, Strain CCMP1168" /LENGTH=264 /DNA_ID=CAMNT_0053670319 /DNA_START=50 /DNA_END=844 /DNA_ORIENTATION=+